MTGHPGKIHSSFIAMLSCVALAGCLQNTGVVTKSIMTSAIQQGQANCALPNQAAVKSIDRRLAAAGVVVGPDFCAKSESYTCYRRVFSPTVGDGQSTESECAKVAALGGQVCLKVESRNYNTFEASRQTGVSPTSVLPGGEYNRSEYVCSDQDLKDGDHYLAIGEDDSLGGALSAAIAECSSIAPRLGGSGG
jgi:hypothetical protein